MNRAMQLAAKAAGVAPELFAVAVAVYPELRDAVDELRKQDWDDVAGPEKARLIADEVEDVLDALDDHIPGWSDNLTEEQRDKVLAHVKKAFLGQVETIYHLKEAGEILRVANVLTVPRRLVDRIRNRRRVAVRPSLS